MKLRCPECRKAFSWDVNLAWPNRCPFPSCQAEMGNNRADDDVVMPFITSSQLAERMARTDDVYRQMEAGSEQRAQQAASLAGVPLSEMSDLKITNLKDARKPGEIAAVPVNNAVSQIIDRGIGGFQGSNGVEYSAGVQAGAYANAGAKMRTTIHQHHTELTRGVAVCDRPGLETQQPGYRRRG